MTSDRKTAVITGANTGLGFEMAGALGARGWRVVVSGRSPVKVGAALDRLQEAHPSGRFEPGIVDLNRLASVRSFAEDLSERLTSLDILLNNAGIMAPPEGRTEDGFESQFGVNFVAHFALTGRVLPLLEAAPAARIVTLSSIAHRGATLDFGSFRLEKRYDAWRAYNQSKLADLIFALELDRQLRAKGSPVRSLAAHPGVSQTELTRNLGAVPPGIHFMTAADGAAPALVAATSPKASGGQYWGPDGPGERSGQPGLASIDPAVRDQALAARLWRWAEENTGLTYP